MKENIWAVDIEEPALLILEFLPRCSEKRAMRMPVTLMNTNSLLFTVLMDCSWIFHCQKAWLFHLFQSAAATALVSMCRVEIWCESSGSARLGEIWELSVIPGAVGSMEAKPFPCALLTLPWKKWLDKMHIKFGVCLGQGEKRKGHK